MDNGNEPLVEGMERLPEGAPPRIAASAGLRESLRDSTSRVVRTRVRRRRVAWWAGGVAVAYVAGMWTMIALSGLSDRAPNVPGRPDKAPVEVATAPGQPTVPTPIELPRVTAEMIRDPEKLALFINKAAPECRSTLLRQAGDLYLEGMGDIARAMHCYERALQQPQIEQNANCAAGPERETWLYQSLKECRIKETHDANKTT